MDECFNESPPSEIHKTVLLVISSTSSGVFLSWSEYEGLTYDKVVILRGASPSSLEEYEVLSGDIFSYTDPNPSAAEPYYQLVLGVSIDCNIRSSQFELKSNIAGPMDSTTTSTVEVEWVESIYPNPISESLTIQLESAAELIILNVSGQILQKHSLIARQNQIDTRNLVPGLYLLQLAKGEEVFMTKIIKH